MNTPHNGVALKKSGRVVLMITGSIVLAACNEQSPPVSNGTASPSPSPAPYYQSHGWSFWRWFSTGNGSSGGSYSGWGSGWGGSGDEGSHGSARGGFGGHGGGGFGGGGE